MSNRHLPVGTRDEFGPRAIGKEKSHSNDEPPIHCFRV